MTRRVCARPLPLPVLFAPPTAPLPLAVPQPTSPHPQDVAARERSTARLAQQLAATAAASHGL